MILIFYNISITSSIKTLISFNISVSPFLNSQIMGRTAKSWKRYPNFIISDTV